MKVPRECPRLLAATFGIACLAGQVDAGFVTDASAIPTPSKVVDFSQFNNQQRTKGPVEIGGLVGESISWTSSSAQSSVGLSPITHEFGANGRWSVFGRGGFTATNVLGASMTYTFNAGPVSAVGGLINYDPDLQGSPDVTITALGLGGVVLQTYDIITLAPISTPGELDIGAFRGIVDSTADIYAFQVANGLVALDDLTFSGPRANVVPEPSSAILVGLGLIGTLEAIRRRRRAR